MKIPNIPIYTGVEKMIACIATAVVVVVVKDVFTTADTVSLVVGVDIGLFFWKLLLLLAGLNMLLDRFSMASLAVAVAVVEFMWELGWRKLLIRLGSFDKDCGVNAFAGRENILRILLLLGVVLVGVVILAVLV